MVCTLKELNEYRQYLTTLKLEAEKMFVREEVGKAECSWAPVSVTVPRAVALLAAPRGGGGEGWRCWAGRCGRERTTGLRAELVQAAGVGTGRKATCKHAESRGKHFSSALVAWRKAERCPGRVGRLGTQGRERSSRQQQATAWCHLSEKALARPGQIRGCLRTAGRD